MSRPIGSKNKPKVVGYDEFEKTGYTETNTIPLPDGWKMRNPVFLSLDHTNSRYAVYTVGYGFCGEGNTLDRALINLGKELVRLAEIADTLDIWQCRFVKSIVVHE